MMVYQALKASHMHSQAMDMYTTLALPPIATFSLPIQASTYRSMEVFVPTALRMNMQMRDGHGLQTTWDLHVVHEMAG